MGCDIHCYIEYKNDNGEWVFANPDFKNYKHDNNGWDAIDGFFTDRDYNLFSLLAGVRGGWDAMKEPCGFPNDATEEVSMVYTEYGDDAHTTTWYDVRELQLLVELTAQKFKNMDGLDDYENPIPSLQRFYTIVDYILDMNGVYYPKIGEARVIMWFDN